MRRASANVPKQTRAGEINDKKGGIFSTKLLQHLGPTTRCRGRDGEINIVTQKIGMALLRQKENRKKDAFVIAGKGA